MCLLFLKLFALIILLVYNINIYSDGINYSVTVVLKLIIKKQKGERR